MEYKCTRCSETKDEREFILENGSIGVSCDGCRHLSQNYVRRQAKGLLPPQISGATVCDVLHSHSTIMQDDPDRLSTDFIKTLLFRNTKCEGE